VRVLEARQELLGHRFERLVVAVDHCLGQIGPWWVDMATFRKEVDRLIAAGKKSDGQRAQN